MAAFYEYAFKAGVRLNKIKEQLYREDTISESEVLLFHGAKTIQSSGRLYRGYFGMREIDDYGLKLCKYQGSL